MNGVPIMDPITKMAKTPRASGDLNPYLSIMTPKLGSRQMELVIPMTSLLKPRSNATGNAMSVPKSPKSCKNSEGPIWKRMSIDWPLEMASLQIRTPMSNTMTPSATLACSISICLKGFAKKSIKPMTSE